MYELNPIQAFSKNGPPTRTPTAPILTTPNALTPTTPLLNPADAENNGQ
jgi:hypothetical protein